MFPFHQSGELSFQVPNDLDKNSGDGISTSNNIYYFPKVEQNMSAASTCHHLHHHAQNYGKKGRSRKSLASTEVININGEGEISGNDAVKKRMVHREIERQRRQEMSNLYSSLRSLLPLEYIRGKRSMCDHITEAAKYIKDMEKNVKELGEKRDKLIKESSSSSSGNNNNLHRDVGGSSSSISSMSDCSVSIHKFSRAIEVEISAAIGEEDTFPLSRALRVLVDEGLNVVSCVSSKVNQRWIHVIHCEVEDVTSIDTSQLQWRLMSEVGSDDS